MNGDSVSAGQINCIDRAASGAAVIARDQHISASHDVTIAPQRCPPAITRIIRPDNDRGYVYLLGESFYLVIETGRAAMNPGRARVMRRNLSQFVGVGYPVTVTSEGNPHTSIVTQGYGN